MKQDLTGIKLFPKQPEIVYLCDRKACDECSWPTCQHTADICHAVNFEKVAEGKYMEKRGLLVTCDRCGESIFLEYKDTAAFDGGYTKVDKFEKRPDRWTNHEGKTLCPSCTNAYEEMMEDFYDDHDNSE